MLNSRPEPVVSTLMPVPANACPGQPVRFLDVLEDDVGAHRLELDVDLRARIVAGDHPFELVPAFAAEREDEQLLRDRRLIGGMTLASSRPSFSSLLIRLT